MSQQHNLAAAFLAYAQGSDLEEVAVSLAIPFEILREKATREGWRRLASALPVPVDAGNAYLERQAESHELVQARLKRLEVNREKNLAIVEQMRDDLAKVVKALHDGTLEIEEVKTTKLGPVTTKRKPNLQDRVALGQYAQSVFGAGYRAVGDSEASSKGEQGAANSNSGGPQNITVILPLAIASPRDIRRANVTTEGPVLDVVP